MDTIEYNFTNIKKSHQGLFFALDFLMLGLVIVNLFWLVFDTFFSSELFQSALTWLSPTFTLFYKENVHPNFIAYDLVFVSIFLTELLVRWVIAVRQKTYHRWFFYPFVHWYDVLGCIPVGSFRWLRLLRLVSILHRLQKYEIIDFSKSYPYRFAKKYIDVLVEEVSDRVVINVLNGVRDEIKTGNPVVGRVVNEVFLPHKQVVVDWLAGRINSVTDAIYEPRKPEIQQYVDKVVSEAIAKDSKISALDKIPLVGDALTDLIENTVSDIVFNALDALIADVGDKDTDSVIKEMIDMVFEKLTEPSDELNDVGRLMLLDAIDVIKDEVGVQQWKLKEADL